MRKLKMIIIFEIYLILTLVLGIEIPSHFFAEDISLLQIFSTFVLINIIGYFFFFWTNKHIKNQDKLLEEYALLNKKLKNNNKLRETILQLSHQVIEIDNINKLFNLILDKAVDVIDDADKGSLLVFDKDNLLEFRATKGYDAEKLKKVRFRLEDTFLWNKSRGNIKEPCIIRNIREFDKVHLDQDNYKFLKEVNALDIQTTLSSPIIINGELYGMLNIDSINKNAFSEEDISLMNYFANQIGVAIRNHQLLEKTVYLSRYDCLTDIYNRYYFEELFKEFFKKAGKYKESFSLAVFDLDRFKQINDTFGHAVGDRVIQHFVKILESNIRESDLLARYGGDEFVAIFFNSNKGDIRNKIEGIMDKLKKDPVKIDNQLISITFSFGIASFPDDACDIDDLFRIADERMYQFKKDKKLVV